MGYGINKVEGDVVGGGEGATLCVVMLGLIEACLAIFGENFRDGQSRLCT